MNVKQAALWHQEDTEKLLDFFGSSPGYGLTHREAGKRLEKTKNVIGPKKESNIWPILVSQFTDTMVLVLMAAAVLSGILGDFVDALAILVIVIMNGLIGFIQEFRAEKALDAIKKLSAPFATVIREGKRLKISGEDAVPGDIMVLEAGDRVAADIRLISSANLEIEESCLTGESQPVLKQTAALPGDCVALADQTNMAFMGTVVTRGRGLGLVVATGMNTVVGGIAQLIQDHSDQNTPLQRRLDHLSKVLIVVCIVTCLLVMALGLYRGENLMRMILTGISLAVAAVPEGLPAIVTVVLALGVQRMVKRHAIVRRLPAVETLGCTTVICSDKTGTITQNQMTVRKLATWDKELMVSGDGYSPEGRFTSDRGRENPLDYQGVRSLIEIGLLCNNSALDREGGHWILQGDPTEGALLALAKKAGVSRKGDLLREIPFDSERKRMSVVLMAKRGPRLYVKGALEAILPLCSGLWINNSIKVLTSAERQFFLNKQEEWAGEAHRVLAFAFRDIESNFYQKVNDKELESDLCLVGICGIIDPPRPGVARAVSECQRAGITPIMITGDHPATALAIARQVGIAQGFDAIGPAEIERTPVRELAHKAMERRVFARVAPQHKLKIVEALRSIGHVVAMTGDGVNDAPAIKEADIGIAMGQAGTEVAKEAADMVLANDDFSTIVAAVHEGRAIYENIRKFIRYLLGCNVGEVLTMFLASLLGMPLPLIPIQILWVNLVTDGLPAMALGLEPPEPGLMKRKPRKASESVFSRGLGWSIARRGLYIGVSTLAVLTIGLIYSKFNGFQDLELARTMAFTNLVFAQLFFVFECRSEEYSPFELGFFTNRALLAAVACSVVMQLMVVYFKPMNTIFETAPLPLWSWLVIACTAGWSFILKLGRFLIENIKANNGPFKVSYKAGKS